MTTVIGQFIHPGLAWAGLGLASVPVIIHILNRRRFRKVPWAAMEFLLAAHRRSSRRLRLEQLLLLLIRCLIIALLGAGLARPFLSPAALMGLGQARRHHVLLIDNSHSTRAPGLDTASVFEGIREQALRLVDSYPVADPVSVVVTSDAAAVVLEQGSYDRRLVREAIENLEPTYRGTDLSGAFALALQVLKQSELPSSNREVVLLADDVRSAWVRAAGTDEEEEGRPSAATRAGELADQAELLIVQSSPRERANLCVTEFSVGSNLVGTSLPTPFQVRVLNASDRSVTGVRAQVLQAGRIVRELDVPPLDAGGDTTMQFRLQFSEGGAQNLEVVLVGGVADVLEADSRRYLTLDVTESARVLLVDGKPAAARFESQSGYLSTALAPGKGGSADRPIEPKIITDPELVTEVFSEYGIIVLCNVRRLATETWLRLAEFMRDGGALIVFLGDNVLVEDYNRLGFDGGKGALACSIGGRAMRGGNRESDYVLFSREELSHPVVADFADQSTGSLFQARIWQYARLIEPKSDDADASSIRTVLRYVNGDPAIVERLIGKGTSLMVSTTANMEWTNLPAKGDFVSLVWNLMGYAWPRGGIGRNVRVGSVLRAALTPSQFSSVNEFVLPTGERASANVVPAGEGFAAELDSADEPGFYAHESANRRTLFASNLDPSECDLAPIGEAELRELIGAPFEIFQDELPRKRAASTSAKRELGWNMLYVAYLLILLEPLLAMWFGQYR